MKKLICVVLSVMLFMSACAFTAFANEGDISVYLDGNALIFDVPPMLVDSRTMVPMRKIFESMGATVSWDADTQSITATKDSTTIFMQIDNTQMIVNNNTITLDVPPMLHNSRTLVPVRAVAESFNANVQWDGETNSVIISSTAYTFPLGYVNGNVYENPFIGIGCKLGESWRFSNEEELRALNNIAMDIVGDEYKNLILNSTVLQDMFASNAITSENININLEKADKTTIAALDIAKNYEVAALLIKDMYEDIGATNFNSNVIKVNIDGRGVDALVFDCEIAGIKLHQVSVMLKCDGYVANITTTGASYDAIYHILENFYWLK